MRLLLITFLTLAFAVGCAAPSTGHFFPSSENGSESDSGDAEGNGDRGGDVGR